MSNPPSVETDRLMMSMPVPSDAGAMVAFVTENREHFAPWDPTRPDEYFTVSYWRTALEDLERKVADGASLQFVLRRRDDPIGAIIGQCTFSGIVRGPFQAAYLGYGLDHRAVGKGLMAEALGAAIDYSFVELNLHRLMANYMPENDRSARLLERLGFVIEGYAKDYLFLAGGWRDHVLTSLTNENWVNPVG